MESGEEILPVALDWLEKNRERDNWFLHVHLWDPHTPYRAPMEFGNPFNNDQLNTWIDSEILEQHKKMTGPHSIRDLNMYNDDTNPKYPRALGKADNLDGLKAVFDGYDCGIKYADSLIGQIFDLLKRQGIYKDTAIMITSDHGENMGELGIYCEHGTADYPTCHIPFILKWPRAKKGVSDSELHYHLDILPTVADLLNVEKCSNWDGKSFANTVTCGEKSGRESLVLSQMAHVCQRSARFENWLYIRTYHDGFRLFDREMLFDLAEDPYEQNDLSEKYPEVCVRGAKIILDWYDEQMLRSQSQIDPLWTVIHEGGPFHASEGMLRPYLERLEATGREEGDQRTFETPRETAIGMPEQMQKPSVVRNAAYPTVDWVLYRAYIQMG